MNITWFRPEDARQAPRSNLPGILQRTIATTCVLHWDHKREESVRRLIAEHNSGKGGSIQALKAALTLPALYVSVYHWFSNAACGEREKLPSRRPPTRCRASVCLIFLMAVSRNYWLQILYIVALIWASLLRRCALYCIRTRSLVAHTLISMPLYLHDAVVSDTCALHSVNWSPVRATCAAALAVAM